MSGSGDKSARGLGNLLCPFRFIAFLALLPTTFAIYAGVFPNQNWRDALAVSFDLAALVFLISVVPLLNDRDPDEIRVQAKRQS